MKILTRTTLCITLGSVAVIVAAVSLHDPEAFRQQNIARERAHAERIQAEADAKAEADALAAANAANLAAAYRTVQAMIISAGYVCENVDYASGSYDKTRMYVKCNQRRYSYTIADRGGSIVVTVD